MRKLYLPLLLLSGLSLSAQFYNGGSDPETGDYDYQPPADLHRHIDPEKPVYTLPGEVVISNGVANYSIPLDLPDGINGAQPGLSINYSSQGGTGTLGIGWGLGGLSAITLRRHEHAPDGEKKGIDLHSTTEPPMNYGDFWVNEYSLDGQPLVRIGGGLEFRTLYESHQRIEFITAEGTSANRTDGYFKITTKEGTQLFYGEETYGTGDPGTGPARLYLQPQAGEPGTTVAWYLERVTDPYGYSVKYLYKDNPNGGEKVIDRILYACPSDDRPCDGARTEVKFKYARKAEVRDQIFINGLFTKETALLTEIVVKDNEREFSRYTFDYTKKVTDSRGDIQFPDRDVHQDHRFSKLVAINYRSQGEVDVNPTLISYHESGGLQGFASSDMRFEKNGNHDQWISFDINGDNSDDILSLEHNEYRDNDVVCHFELSRVDIIRHEYIVKKHISNGTGSAYIKDVVVPLYRSEYRGHDDVTKDKPKGCSYYPYSKIYSGDFNGDGLGDFALLRCNRLPSTTAWNVDIYSNDLSNPGDFTLTKTIPLPYAAANGGVIRSINHHDAWVRNAILAEPISLYVGDYNGDGITDICYKKLVSHVAGNGRYFKFQFMVFDFETNHSNVFNERGFVLDVQATPYQRGNYVNNVHLGDFNGDGAHDLLVVYDDGHSKVIDGLSLTTNFDGQGSRLDRGSNYPNAYHYNFVADANADGITDIISVDRHGTWRINLSTGKDWLWPHITPPINEQVKLNVGSGGVISSILAEYSTTYSIPFVTDCDDDGRADIVLIGKKAGAAGSSSMQNNSDIEAEIYYNFSKNSWPKQSINIPVTSSQNQVLTNAPFGIFQMSYIYNGAPTIHYFYSEQRDLKDNRQFLLALGGRRKMQKIYQILNGFNQKSTLLYSKLTNGGWYGRGVHYLQNNDLSLASKSWMVTRSSTTSFVSNTDFISKKRYSYKGSVMNREGLGFMAFEEVEEIDELTNFTRVIHHEATPIDPNFRTVTSRPWRLQAITVKNAAGDEVSNERYTYFSESIVGTTGGTHIYRPLVDTKVITDEFNGNSVKTTYDYDLTNGNLTQEKTETFANTSGNGAYLTREITDYSSFVTGAGWYDHLPENVLTIRTRSGKDPVQKETEITYNNKGQVVEKAIYPGAEEEVREAYVYDNTYGYLIQTIVSTPNAPAIPNIANKVSYILYESTNRYPETETNPDGWVTTYAEHNNRGLPTSVTEANGFTSTLAYDVFGRKTSKADHLGVTATKAYNWLLNKNEGKLFEVNTNGSHSLPVKTIYDGHVREMESHRQNQTGDWIKTITEYNANGTLHRHSLPVYATATPANWTTYGYDSYLRQNQITGPTKTIDISYSANSVTTTNTTANQSETQVSDASGQLINLTDAGGTITYNYNSLDLPISISAPGKTVTMEYDDRGNQVVLNDPAMGPMTYTYDVLNRLHTQTDNKQNTITLTYDILDQILTKQFQDAEDNEFTISFERDNIVRGRLDSKTHTGSEVTVANEWNPITGLLMVKHESSPQGDYSIRYTYDPNTYNLLSVTYPNDFSVQHFYDSNNQLKQIKEQATQLNIWNYKGQDEYGQVTDYDLGQMDVGKTYDPITGIMDHDIGTGFGWDYQIDPATGNLQYRQSQNPVRKEQFQYDGLNRLEHGFDAASFTITYGPSGNITSKTDVGTYDIDNLGRINEIIENPNTIHHGLQSIEYNQFNSVSYIQEGDYEAFFTYGPYEQRTQMVIEQHGREILSREYLFNGLYEREHQSGNTTEYAYIPTPSGTEAVYISGHKVNRRDQVYYLKKDYQGSILQLTDAEGTVQEHQSFDPWGMKRDHRTYAIDYQPGINGTNLSSGIMFRGYTGHEHLEWFGLINMNGRLYDPLLGRMLSPDNYVQDPISTQNFNRYSYVLNNPLKYVDPSGEFVVVDSWLVGFVHGFFSQGSNHFENGWNEANQRAGNDLKIWGGLFVSDPNKNFLERAWEIHSRFTWQAPQTAGGFLTAHTYNTLGLQGGVQSVEYWGGATVVTTGDDDWGAVAQGSFIVGNSTLEANPNNPLFQHEYGHYLQSQAMGIAYYPRIGIPSILSDNEAGHDFHPVEQDANRRAFLYFNRNVENFLNDIDLTSIDPTNNLGWDFFRNPLNVDRSNTRLQHVDFGNENQLRALNGLSVRARWYDYAGWVFPGVIQVGLINAYNYNRQ